MTDDAVIPEREPLSRWLLMWRLYGLPRCSQASYPANAPHCWRLIWPWQPREIRNGAPIHVACVVADAAWAEELA